MKTRSAKNKGKRLQNDVRDLILETFKQLEPDDVRSTTMGDSGEDILLSPAARKLFPFSVECKNQEKLNIWSSLEQAEDGIRDPLWSRGLGDVYKRQRRFVTFYLYSWLNEFSYINKYKIKLLK